MQKLSRAQGIVTRLVDGEAFLISKTSITHLNPTATVIWTLLEETVSENEVREIMRNFYPNISGDQIRKDISTVINTLSMKHLIRED